MMCTCTCTTFNRTLITIRNVQQLSTTPVRCAQQIKQTTTTIWPRSGWICFLNKQCVHLITQEIALAHIKNHGEGHRLFPQGTLPSCVMWREKERRTNCGMLLLHLNVCQRNPSCVSFTASFHFVQKSITPSFPLSLSTALSHFWPTPDMADMSICAPDIIACAWVCVHMRLQVCVFDTSRIGPFVHLNDLNFGVPPGSASMCIDQTF